MQKRREITSGARSSLRRLPPLHPLDGAREGEQAPFAGSELAANEDQRAAGARHLAGTFDQFTLARSIKKVARERDGDGGAAQFVACDRKQAIVRKRHEAATMDVAGAVEVLPLDPERAAHPAVGFRAVPERAGVGLVTVARPGAPALELAVGRLVQVGALDGGGFG